MDMKEYAHNVEQALHMIREQVDFVPRAALILGSGLGSLADAVQDPIVIPYENIPHWRSSTAPGHAGRLVCGKMSGLPVVVMQGRLHGYEGYTPLETTFPIRVLGLWGVKTLIVTNASGGINTDYRSGDIVLIEDHINFTGANPLTGPNVEEWGPRFPDMTEAYNRALMALAEEAAASLGIPVHRGVYIGMSGPSYETPAEIRMARAMGADVVGMSTVHPVIVANHMGMNVCGISCVSNPAAGLSAEKLSGQAVVEEMMRTANKLSAIVQKMFALMQARG